MFNLAIGLRKENPPLEIALVLDVTRSMEQKKKMQDLKMLQRADPCDYRKANASISLVPFNSAVKLDARYPYESWLNPDYYNRYKAGSKYDTPNPAGEMAWLHREQPGAADTDDITYRQTPLIPYNEDIADIDNHFGYGTEDVLSSATRMAPCRYASRRKKPIHTPGQRTRLHATTSSTSFNR